jgi:hypothetical protein
MALVVIDLLSPVENEEKTSAYDHICIRSQKRQIIIVLYVIFPFIDLLTILVKVTLLPQLS